MRTTSNDAPLAGNSVFRLSLLAAASAAALAVAAPAQAGCAPGNGGPRDYLCTGPIGATNFLDARTVALAGATVSGGLAVAPTTGGNIGFTMDPKSSITTQFIGESGVSLVTSDGNIDTTTPSGSGINGAINSVAGTALEARTTNGNINVKTSSGGTLSAGRYGAGLNASTTGVGAINLDLGAKVSGFVGVNAATVNGAINMKVGAEVAGGYAGIIANASGSGAVAITTTGNVTAGGFGISALSGSGNISLNLGGEVTSSALAVSAQSGRRRRLDQCGRRGVRRRWDRRIDAPQRRSDCDDRRQSDGRDGRRRRRYNPGWLGRRQYRRRRRERRAGRRLRKCDR